MQQIKTSSITALKKYKNLIFVDVETTGLDSKRDRVIEVGIVKVDKNGVVSDYSQLINPGIKLPKEIRMLTGIRQKDVTNAPTFPEIFPILSESLKADLFVAHNSRFDFEFLSEEFARLESELFLPHLDTVKLARVFYPNYITYNLDSIIARLKIKVAKRHRGLDDARVLWTLYQKIIVEFGEEALLSEIDKLITIPKRRVFSNKAQTSLF